MNNYWTNNTIFEKYVEACSSRFAAIMYVSKIARHRRSRVNGCITESQALAWVITGVEPLEVSLWRKDISQPADKALIYAEDRILYIEDPKMHEAVLHTITESRHHGHLIYRYKDLEHPSQKARLRVICNIIWDEMKQVDLNNQISTKFLNHD